MTNFELIKQGKHKGFNELLETSVAYTIAEMLSTFDCGKCMCRIYCRNHEDDGSTCQEIIEEWLNEEEENEAEMKME